MFSRMTLPQMVSCDVYTTVTSQAISSCGRLLCAADSYGRLAVFDLDKIHSGESKNGHFVGEEKERERGPVGSLEDAGDFLAVGVPGEIVGRSWKGLADPGFSKPDWKIQIPYKQKNIDRPDVNSLWWNRHDGNLYAGCGDGNVYSFDLSQGKLIRKYEGHDDYLHSVRGLDSNLITAAEDGHVKLWDSRTPKAHSQIVPHSNDKLARPDLGKWIGSAAMSEDWIICGGGPKLGLWQLRSLQVAVVPEIPNHGIHVCFFHEDRLFAAGTAPHLYQLNYSGAVEVEIPVSATTVYSVVLQCQPRLTFTIAGSSPYIDFCTNFNYKDQVLQFGE